MKEVIKTYQITEELHEMIINLFALRILIERNHDKYINVFRKSKERVLDVIFKTYPDLKHDQRERRYNISNKIVEILGRK